MSPRYTVERGSDSSPEFLPVDRLSLGLKHPCQEPCTGLPGEGLVRGEDTWLEDS